MTSPSEQCKAAGLKSLTELVGITGESKQTIINWHKNKPILFKLVLLGALTSKHGDVTHDMWSLINELN